MGSRYIAGRLEDQFFKTGGPVRSAAFFLDMIMGTGNVLVAVVASYSSEDPGLHFRGFHIVPSVSTVAILCGHSTFGLVV